MSALRAAQVTAGALLLLALTACGSGEPAVMPDVAGKQLDIAKSDIERAGFGGDVEVLSDGLFGVIDESNWLVCEQEPAAGEAVSEPRLVVDRECESADESTDPSAEPAEPSAESSEPSAEPTAALVSDTTVDELLDRLNSAGMGGIQPGEQFRFTGELIWSDVWMTGATGDYVVYFKAKGGADDLMILLDESEAAGWTDGTRLEVVVENTEVDLNGEKSYGWLRLVSAATLS